MKCSICGNEISSTDKFCSNCGAKQTPMPEASNSSVNTSPQYNSQQQYGQSQGQQYGNAQYNAQQHGYPQGQQYGNAQYNAQQQHGYPQGQQYGNAQYNTQQQYGNPQYNNEPISPDIEERINRGEVISPAHVGFSDAVKLFFKNYLNFNGRSTASEYWYAVLFSITISCIISLTATAMSLSNFISGIWGVIVLIPTVAVSARRLHDMGKSGFWYLPFFIYSVVSDISLFTESGTEDMIETVTSNPLIDLIVVIYAIRLILWLVKPSQPFTNKWGPSAQHMYKNQGYGFSYKNPPYFNGNTNYNYNNNYNQYK